MANSVKDVKEDPRVNNQTVLVVTNYSKDRKNDVNREGSNKPEERQELIYQTLKTQGYNFLVPKQLLTPETLIELKVHDKQYLEFLKNAYSSFMESPDPDFKKQGGLVPYHFACGSNRKLNAKLPYWKQMGYFCDDSITPINEHTYQSAMESANNSYAAADLVDEYRLVYCLNSSPGHHARPAGCSGYCFLNNGFICAARLVQKGYKVAVLDLDYHSGALPLPLDNILTISIHADPTYEYPTYVGHESDNTTRYHNVIFKKRATWNDNYAACLEKALALIKTFSADVIVIPFGGDTFKEDPDPSVLYGCALELDDYTKMGHEIAKLGKKIIITQEGGYCMEKIADVVKQFLKGLKN